MKIRITRKFMCTSWLTVMLFLFIIPMPTRIGDQNASYQQFGANFPDSLKYVGEEAFEGTSFEVLFFKEGFLQAGERSFSNMKALCEAYFPSSTEYIAASAFSGSSITTILGHAGTYVEKWAARYGLKFEMRDCWIGKTADSRFGLWVLTLLTGMLCPLPNDIKRKIRRYLKALCISMRPQDRPELNPIDYRFP